MANLSEQIEQQFRVESVPTVVVSNTRGYVHVVAGDAGQVAASVHKRVTAANEAAAQRIMENIIVDMIQDGDQIRIETRPRERFGFNKWFNNGDPWHVDIDLTVPATTNLRLALNAGDASIRDITGALEAHLNSGNLAVTHGHVTETGDFHLNSGDVTLAQVMVEGATRFVMNSGDVTLHAVTFAGHTEMKTNSGDIHGDVTLGDHADLRLALNAGDVRLELPAATAAHLDVAVTAGKVRLEGFPVTITSHYAQSFVNGDLAPHPTSTITCRINAGNLALAAR